MSSKKLECKSSCLNGYELQMTYNTFRRLINDKGFAKTEESNSADPNEPVPGDFFKQVNAILSMMESKLQEPQSLSFSGMTSENLTKLKITFSDNLILKHDIQERIKKSTSLGKDSMWSSDNFYSHLLWLEGHVAWSTEASARMWIDAFFCRASAMLTGDKRMILNMEHAVPATTISPSNCSTLSGFIDYSAVVTSQESAAVILTTPQLHALKSLKPDHYTFFIVEAKFSNILDHVPQAVSQMYASGKFLQKKFIRGALTNGREWIFLHLKFTDTYEGASYSQSIRLNWKATENLDGVGEILAPWPDLIAAVLADWIETSFEDIGSDDWFKPI